MSMCLLMTMALLGRAPLGLVFAAATLYWAGGLAAGPAWNAWVEHLVPNTIRANYFGRRSRLCQVSVFLALGLGGLLLRGLKEDRAPLAPFTVLFGLAAAFRLLSVIALHRQTERPEWVEAGEAGDSVTPWRVGKKWLTAWRASWSREVRSLVLYLLTMQTAVYVASPYFTPFMLDHLQLNYLQYMYLLCLSFAGKMLAMPWAATLARRLGADRLLWLGGIGIIPLAGLWLVSRSMLFLSALQLAGGCVWACYELAMLLLFFERIPKKQRLGVLTFYNLGNSAAMVAGSLIGGGLLTTLRIDARAYLLVFLSSSLLRLVTLLLLPRLQESRYTFTHLAARIIAVRPGMGAMQRPVLPSIEQEPAVVNAAGFSENQTNTYQ